jgi:hypothetical protein
LRSLFPFVRLSVIALPLALFGACGDSNDAMTNAARGAESDDAPPPRGPTTSFSDASTPPQAEATGLCGAIAKDVCAPDDDGQTPRDGYGTSEACASVPDGGLAGTSDAGAAKGCRIARATDGSSFAPKCEEANPEGTDGAPCGEGRDCAPGFDCIEEEKSPVCRHYCCSGSCENQLSQNAGKTFCDIRKLANLDQHLVPVCMPIKACKLLRHGECSDKETCAVVTENGDTGCVPRGNAKVDMPCDEEHCDSNLTCLGTPGARKCFQLCRVDGSDCPVTHTCTTGSVFQDTSFGVCKAN